MLELITYLYPHWKNKFCNFKIWHDSKQHLPAWRSNKSGLRKAGGGEGVSSFYSSSYNALSDADITLYTLHSLFAVFYYFIVEPENSQYEKTKIDGKTP